MRASLSPRIHAREERALPLGQADARKGTPAPSGICLTPAITALCGACHSRIRVNEILGISFCEIHGLDVAFAFPSLAIRGA